MDNEGKQFADRLQALADQFDQLCVERHNEGQKEYGTFTFLDNDIVKMMVEELADTANYCRYQAIKLLLLDEELQKTLGRNNSFIPKDQNVEVNIGAHAFKGVGNVGWKGTQQR